MAAILDRDEFTSSEFCEMATTLTSGNLYLKAVVESKMRSLQLEDNGGQDVPAK
eukprot:CAMPEP_0180611886 /NCGR_PEP_ID=MMETSP1037_2-20121125/30071_1 /TAXON_ID=632150 /ORGANISM="Azadinium spinosum, Strain 3D9" /LENGTH=53 /DNA_ID=CAMNT_0022631459 /DNA_START=317 /DNA_END=475 /DNA_ORIENTATION=+